MASYLVTESSRGIGLGLVTYLLTLPHDQVKIVFATARDSKNSASLVSLANSPEGRGRIVLVTLDMCDRISIDNAAMTVQRALGSKSGLDVLINNAGILARTPTVVELTDEGLLRNLQTNSLGVHRVIGTFLPLLRAGHQKKVINLGATLRATTVPTKVAEKAILLPASGYAISEATTNVLNTQWAMTLKDEGFIVAAICPSWARDDVSAGHAMLAPGVECKAMIEKIKGLDHTSNGKVLTTHVSEVNPSEPVQPDGCKVSW